MSIDWKHLASTEGYKSLKKAMTDDITNRNRQKAELFSKFQWVIYRALHYSIFQNRTLEEVLNEWEQTEPIGG